MGDGNSCEVCGGTDMNLVGGFYYCVECGTQDTNVQETVVEHTMVGDGEFGIATTKKFSVKIKKGVEMSPEWYKWHAYNFMLAGLTERLVQLGAEPGVKMKVLWIWTRYMKKYLKKDEFRRTQEVLKIRDSSSGDEAPPAAEEQGERAGWHETHRFSLSRVSRLLLLAVLAAALNLQRSRVGLARLRRLLLHRLLPLNAAHRALPPGIDTGKVEGFNKFINVPVTRAPNLGLALGRLQGGLRLGGWRTPDVEAALAALLRDLGLPAALARLARALLWLAPVPFCDRRVFRRRPPPPRYPDYEPTIAAYLLLALKLCFGLDDDRERRLSARVERVNAAEGRPRLRVGEAAGRGARRLFSWRQWAERLLFRRHVLARAVAPVAHERNARAGDYAVMEQCDEPEGGGGGGGGAGAGRRRGTAVRVGDEVTVDLLRRVPGGTPDAAADAVLAPARLPALLAARAPHAALAEALAPSLPPRARALLDEDFTGYSVDYAFRTLALATEAGEDALGGVSEAGKTLVARLGVHIVRKYDPGVVFVRNCENGNWARTRRPGPVHVVGAGADEPPTPVDADADADGDGGADAKPESFEEEAADGNIFDDDFLDIEVKREPDRFRTDYEDAKENISLNNFSTRENFPPEWSASDVDGDSDEERPRYDPARFDRAETVKRIMAAAYRELRVAPPVRFRTEDAPRARKRGAERAPGEAAPPKRPAPLGRERKRARQENAARVDELVAAYRGSLHRDALHQVARHVRAFLDGRAEPPPAAEPEPGPDELEASSGGTRGADVGENDEDESDEEADGPAEDPVYRGDRKFDDEAHDARQLYIKFTAAPPPAPARGGDEELAGLLDAGAARGAAADRPKRKAQAPPPAPQFPLLAEAPARVRSFRVWFRHYRRGFHQPEEWSRKLEREVEEELPRSFRLVLREAAHSLCVSAAVLYARVMAAEAALLRALGRAPARRGPPGPARDLPGPDGSRADVPPTAAPSGAGRGRRSRRAAPSGRAR